MQNYDSESNALSKKYSLKHITENYQVFKRKMKDNCIPQRYKKLKKTVSKNSRTKMDVFKIEDVSNPVISLNNI